MKTGRKPIHGHRHRGKRTSEYISWDKMVQRCSNPKNASYSRYGALGITVCQRWLGVGGFENFLSDMGEKPSSKHSLDRFPNNSGNYFKENCRWATMIEQQNNRSDNVFIEIEGVRKTVSEWARFKNIKPTTLYGRIKSGKPIF